MGDKIMVAVGGILVGILLGLIIHDHFGVASVSPAFQSYAVEQGHAEYYLDKDHERQWRWKELK